MVLGRGERHRILHRVPLKKEKKKRKKKGKGRKGKKGCALITSRIKAYRPGLSTSRFVQGRQVPSPQHPEVWNGDASWAFRPAFTHNCVRRGFSSLFPPLWAVPSRPPFSSSARSAFVHDSRNRVLSLLSTHLPIHPANGRIPFLSLPSLTNAPPRTICDARPTRARQPRTRRGGQVGTTARPEKREAPSVPPPLLARYAGGPMRLPIAPAFLRRRGY